MKRSRRSNRQEDSRPDLVRELCIRINSRSLGQTGRRVPNKMIQQEYKEVMQAFVEDQNIDGAIAYIEALDFVKPLMS